MAGKKIIATRTTINQKQRPIDFADVQHAQFGTIRIGFDHNTATRQAAYFTALLNSRGLPNPNLLGDANYLNAKDRFVRYYLSIKDENGAPVFNTREAIQMARNAYEMYLDTTNSDALLLALMFYTEFDGKPKDEFVFYNAVSELAEENSLPPLAKKPLQFFKAERKAAFIREALATDPEFQRRLNAETERLWAIMNGEEVEQESEPVDEVTGFHRERTDADVPVENDAVN